MELVFARGFERGALHHIATRGGTQPYANPHTAGLVAVQWSSKAVGEECRFVQHQVAGDGYAFTTNAPGSWMAVDLKRPLLVTHYALRHGYDDGMHVLRHWQLQGSAGGEDWTTLRAHVDDAALAAAAHSEASWPVDSRGREFRRFRVLQTGKNSNDNDYLMCAGIELWGLLSDA